MNARSKGRLTSEAQRGQALVLGLLLLAVAVASLAMLRGVGRVVEARMRLTHAADAAAYSGALAQARRLNLLAYANRTLVAHQVAMAHLVTLEASMAFTRTLAGQRRRNNPPVRLLATLFGRDVAAAYRVARAEPGTAAGLAQAYAEHDRVVHQVLAVGMASAVADLPATRARLMRLVLQDNHPTAPVPSIRMLSDGWPAYLERRDAMGHAGLRSAVEQAVQRYDFVGRRDGTRRNAVPAVAHCPRGHHTLRRRGATWLGADGRWGAVDTQSFHSLRFNRWAGCYLREYAMGWGAVLGDGSRAPSDLEHVENPPADFIAQDFWRWVRQSTSWDLRTGTGTPLANSYAVAQGQRWPGQGLPDYYELAHCCQTAPLRFAVAVKLDRDTAPKTAIMGGLFLPGADAALTVTSAAETFFSRPQARADGYTELATLFRPYWQARLSPVTTAEALLARATP